MVGLLVLFGVALLVGIDPAAAATPTSTFEQKESTCNPDGHWTLHWLLTNTDSSKLAVSLKVGSPSAANIFRPVQIEPQTAGHAYAQLALGTSGPVSIYGSVTFTDGSGSRDLSGPVGVGICSAQAATTTTSPAATVAPGQPGTTVPAGGRATTTTGAPGASTTTAPLAQTNG
ncbi:MAG TPA: hypothetical protein VIJ47_09060, partial [Acidimicrobiales bacterium]